MHRRSSVCSLITDGIIRHESRQSKVHDPLRYAERIIWRDPDGGDASARAVERGLSRIFASADNNDTVPTSDAGRQAKRPASDAGCASQRTRATSTDPSMSTGYSAGAALILGTGDGGLLPHTLRYKI
jgi:hypothetical protein